MDFERIIDGATKWFEQRLNRSDLFGEAALIIAIGEQIDDAIHLRPEKDFKFVTDDDRCPAGYFNYDLVGLVGDEPALKPKYLFEMKYLKQSEKSDLVKVACERVIDDIFKLSLPDDTDLERYLVLGCPNGSRLPDNVKNLLKLTEVDVNASLQDKNGKDRKIIISPSGRLTASVNALGDNLRLPNKCKIESVLGERENPIASIIISVFRISRSSS